jgi:transposase
MAHYKPYTNNKIQIEILFDETILPGTVEHTINEMVEHEIDTSCFVRHYKNDQGGASAYDPKLLLKVVLYAYSQGIISSRKIAECCRTDMKCIALAGGARPHFTTLASFISGMDQEIDQIYLDVLAVCDRLDLIGRNIFALDGCKLPSNASKEWSGTRADFERKLEKCKKAIDWLDKKLEEDQSSDPGLHERGVNQLKQLRAKEKKLTDWLGEHQDKIGRRGTPIKSNITDNESAKMKTSHGVIQGYDGVSMVDQDHQLVVYAEVFGEAQEQHLVDPMIEKTKEACRSIGGPDNVFDTAKLVMDAGFHTEGNMKTLFDAGIDAYVADNHFRQRDPRFESAKRHKPAREKKAKRFRPQDFICDKTKRTCICPGGHKMYLKNQNFEIDGHKAVSFQARLTDCRDCPLRGQCLRREEQKTPRQVYFFEGVAEPEKETYTKRMIRKIDSWKGRIIYGYRIGIVEPVFGNIRSNLGLNRFTLRGKVKVDIQWKLFNIIHNIGKVCRYGDAAPEAI